MIDKGRCDKGFVWDPSNCECECDKSCDVGEYLDYVNSKKCRKKVVDKLVEECSENIDGNEMIYNTTINEKAWSSCTMYIVLFVIAFSTIIDISSGFTTILFFLNQSMTTSDSDSNILINLETVVANTDRVLPPAKF